MTTTMTAMVTTATTQFFQTGMPATAVVMLFMAVGASIMPMTMIMQPGIVCNAGRVVPMGFCTVPEKITQQMINGRELDIIGTRMSLNQWIPTSEKMAAGQYRMEGLATTFVKFSEIDKVFENILHPDPSVKKTVILFDGAED